MADAPIAGEAAALFLDVYVASVNHFGRRLYRQRSAWKCERSGLRSKSGVRSTQSRPRTCRTGSSRATGVTIVVPIDLGLTGERMVKVAFFRPFLPGDPIGQLVDFRSVRTVHHRLPAANPLMA
jgi:hypothetical protein